MQSHKVVKGETLEAIAKKYKAQDWKKTWSAAENKALVAMRKRPDAIQPGDVIVIPQDVEQKKRDAQKTADAKGVAQAIAKVRCALEADTVRIRRKMQILDELIAMTRKSTADMTAELQRSARKLKTTAEMVDAVAGLTFMAQNLVKLASLGYKSLGASGKALEEINKQAAKDVLQSTGGRILDGAAAIAADTLSKRQNTALLAIAATADAWTKMNSLSFWAFTAIRLYQGKSWSQVVSRDIAEEFADRIRQVAADGAKQIAGLELQKNKLAAQLAENAKLAQACKP
jgi:LysM repeat protein